MLEVACMDSLRSENPERELTMVTVDNKVFHSTLFSFIYNYILYLDIYRSLSLFYSR